MSTPPEPAPDQSDKKSSALAVACLLAILLVLYWPLFAGRILFTRDIAHWIFPARAFVRASLLAGELPTWNPLQGLGFPVLGDPLYGVFYPPNWLLLLVGEGWVANAIGLDAFAHAAWGGLGVFLLARRLRAAPLPACIAGLAWSLSGYITAQWTAGLRLHAGAWIPWAAVGHFALLASLRAGGRRWRTGLIKAALPTGMALLLGEVFLAIMGVGLAAGIVTVWVLAERGSAQDTVSFRPRWLAMHALAVGLAFAMGAAVLVPARAVMAGSPRATPLARADAEVSSLHPLRLVECMAPNSMGDVYGDYPAARVVGEARLDGLPLSYSVYLGASVLGLVLLSCRRRILILGLAGLTAFALCLAMGKHLPVHAVIRQVVPPLAYMRFPEKYLTLVVVGVALLAGLGAQRLLFGEGSLWRRTAIALGALIAAGVAAPFIFPFPWSGFMVLGLRHAVIALLALLGVHVLVARKSRLAAPMLVAVVVLDLAVSTWKLQGFVPRQVAAQMPASVALVKRDRVGQADPPRIYRSAATDAVMNQVASISNPADGELRLLATLVPSTVNVWGIATVPGYDAAIPAALDRLWQVGWQDGETRLALLRLLGVDYAVLPARKDAAQTIPGLSLLAHPVPGARILRVTQSLPAVFLAGRGEPMADAAALRRVFEPDIVGGDRVVLAADAPALDGPNGRAGTCTLTRHASRHVEALCRAERPSLAVFVEQFDAGWRATVDGIPTGLERANLVMRALRIEPGEHRLVLDYQAPGLSVGLAVTALALIGLLGLAWSSRQKKDA